MTTNVSHVGLKEQVKRGLLTHDELREECDRLVKRGDMLLTKRTKLLRWAEHVRG